MLQSLHNNLLIQYVDGSNWYASEDHFVWESKDSGQTWEQLCQISDKGKSPFSLLKSRLLRLRTIRTIRKNIGISNVVKLPSGTVIIQYDRIYRFDATNKFAAAVFDLQGADIAPPLKNGICFDKATNALYFGEYRCTRPSIIRIFKGEDDGTRWRECYRFDKGKIRHVHAVISDPHRKRLWVCTGDSDEESALYYTDNGFRTLNRFGGGNQSWRMVSLIPTEDSIIWGTDAGGDTSPYSGNAIYRFNFSTGIREKLFEFINPAYFSIQTPQGMFISTTYEPHKVGACPAVTELLHSENGLQWKIVLSLPYAAPKRPQGTFYGMLLMPTGRGNRLVFTPFNTVSHHFHVTTINERSQDVEHL